MKDYIDTLVDRFEQKLKNGSNSEIRLEVKATLFSLQYFPEETQKDFGKQIAEMIYKHGLDSYNESDFSKYITLLDLSADLYYKFPDVETITLVFLQLTRGMLEIKAEMREPDHLDTHQEDIENVLKQHPSDAEIMLECMVCYANLQANCTITARGKHVSPERLSLIERNVDNMELISSRFPNDEVINLIYCRSLAATTNDLYNHPNREMYGKLFRLLENLVKTRKFDVPEEVIYFLKEA